MSLPKNSLKELIWACEKCPLYKTVQVSPLAPEWSGDPRGGVMCILGGPVKYENDFQQEVISGVDRIGLINTLKDKLDSWYITRLIKCPANNTSGSYTKKTKAACKTWITEEIQRLRPNLIIGFGSDVQKILGANDHPPWAKCDYYLPSVHNVLSSEKNKQQLISILER